MSPLKTLAACLLLSHATPGLADVTVSGDVRYPGSYPYSPNLRMFDVISQAQPNPESYWLAAAWLHQPLLDTQTRLKAGVLFDLKMLERGALLTNKPALAAVASGLHQQVGQLPVTGRKVAVLDPVAMEVSFARNYVLADGDQLLYPPRPSTVTLVGAVAKPCRLPYSAQLEVREYLAGCPRLPEADADYLWLITPDGRAQRVAIAAWNRQDGIYAVAGSTILVPVRNDNTDLPTPDLNEQLAQFLATQPLAEVAP